MITKIRSKIYIHPLYYVIAFICFITGYFKAFSIYTIVLLVHELGHLVAGFILHWPVAKITIYPFGCMTMFAYKLNSSSLEEFFVLLYGPLFQILFYLIYPTPYHYFILLFNLLPIYPFDGAKLCFLLLNKFMSYYNSYVAIYGVSYLIIFVLFLYDVNLINYLVLSFLAYDVYRYIKKLDLTMLKFYFDRYKYPVRYRYHKLIYGYQMKKMFKEKNNYFLINNKYYSERAILQYFFSQKF